MRRLLFTAGFLFAGSRVSDLGRARRGGGLSRMAAGLLFTVIGAAAGLSGPAAAMEEPVSDAVRLHPDQPPISDFMLETIAAQGGASLPILVPDWMTEDARSAEAHGFRLKVTPGGYTAVMSEEGRDIVITGTNPGALLKMRRFVSEIFHSGDETLRSGGESKMHSVRSGSVATFENLDYIRRFSVSDEDGGGSIAFGFAGCDYDVSFYCKGAERDENGSCIGAEEAFDFVAAITP